MSICKYCGKLIEGEPVMNPDENGDGYHHFCIVDKEFRERDKSIFQKGYDKGKADVLDEIRAGILRLDYDIDDIDYDYNDMAQTEEVHMICREEVLQIIDKYKEEGGGKE